MGIPDQDEFSIATSMVQYEQLMQEYEANMQPWRDWVDMIGDALTIIDWAITIGKILALIFV